MSEVQLEQLSNQEKNAKLSLLRDMMNDTNECFDNFDAEQLWQVKNFLDSFAREIA